MQRGQRVVVEVGPARHHVGSGADDDAPVIGGTGPLPPEPPPNQVPDRGQQAGHDHLLADEDIRAAVGDHEPVGVFGVGARLLGRRAMTVPWRCHRSTH